MLREKKVTINGETFIVRGLPLSKGALLENLQTFQGRIDFTVACTFMEDGSPIDPDVHGVDLLEALMNAAVDVNKLDEGKD
jgi:hypothetical protein